MTANGVTEPGSTPSASRKSSGEPKESRPEAPMRPVRALQVDRRLVLGDNEEKAALLVLDEEVFGMRAGNARLDRARFGDGEDRRVRESLGLDPQRDEAGEEVLGVGMRQVLHSGLAFKTPQGGRGCRPEGPFPEKRLQRRAAPAQGRRAGCGMICTAHPLQCESI